MEKEKNEIEVLTMKSEVVVAGTTLTIKPWSFTQMFEVVKPISILIQASALHIEAISTVLDCFTVNSKEAESLETDTVTTIDQQKLIQAFMQLMTGLGEDSDKLVKSISDVIKITLNKDQDFINELDMEEAFNILSAIYVVNKSFFQERLAKIKAPSSKMKK